MLCERWSWERESGGIPGVWMQWSERDSENEEKVIKPMSLRFEFLQAAKSRQRETARAVLEDFEISIS